MTNPVRQSQTTLMDRYQAYRTRRFLKQERSWSKLLPGWRTRSRRRILVVGLAISFAFMFAVSVLCAFGVQRAPLLWLPACLLFFPLWIPLQIVSGRQGDAPRATLDEFEIAQRDSARSVGLTATQNLMMIPIFYLLSDRRRSGHPWARREHGVRRRVDGADHAARRWVPAGDYPRLDPAGSAAGGLSPIARLPPRQEAD